MQHTLFGVEWMAVQQATRWPKTPAHTLQTTPREHNHCATHCPDRALRCPIRPVKEAGWAPVPHTLGAPRQMPRGMLPLWRASPTAHAKVRNKQQPLGTTGCGQACMQSSRSAPGLNRAPHSCSSNTPARCSQAARAPQTGRAHNACAPATHSRAPARVS